MQLSFLPSSVFWQWVVSPSLKTPATTTTVLVFKSNAEAPKTWGNEASKAFKDKDVKHAPAKPGNEWQRT
jgi:hypothetical protein